MEDGRMETVEVTVTVRRKNQMTVPDVLAERLGLHPGDRLVLRLEEGADGEPGFRARPLRRSYAGALRGVYGTPEDAAAYLAGERAAWGEE
jgi:AbrB family looped-hinge helix DNA binding protein